MYIYYRVRGAKQLGKRVIHVDGSYLYRKQLQLESSGVVCAPLPPPTFPPLGWTRVTDVNQEEIKRSMPFIHPTTLFRVRN